MIISNKLCLEMGVKNGRRKELKKGRKIKKKK
jgi:hypothetical protein